MGAKLTSVKDLLVDGRDGPEVMLGWFTIYTTANPNSPFTKMSARSQLLTKVVNIKDHDQISLNSYKYKLAPTI